MYALCHHYGFSLSENATAIGDNVFYGIYTITRGRNEAYTSVTHIHNELWNFRYNDLGYIGKKLNAA